MSEKPQLSQIETLAEDLKNVLDLGELKIFLKGKDKKIVEHFSNLERTIFGELPDGGVAEIQPDAKNKALIEIFSESVKLLLERLGGLEEEVKGVETEEVLARIESRDPSKKLSDIGGFTNEATTDQARNALEQVSFYAYSILFEYVRAGLLDEEQIEELGFGMGAVEAIRNFLREEEEKKLEEWKKDLEDNFPLLIDLKNAFSLSITDDEKLEKGIEDLETSLTNARAALVGEKGDQKEDHLKNTYWNVAEKKLEEWRERFRTHREEIAKNNLAEEKKDNINDFLNSIRGLQDALGEVPATGEEIWEMKISGAFNKFVDLEESLRKQRRKIQEEWTKLESAGILKEKTSSFLGDEEVNSEIKSLKEKYRDTISLLESYIEAAEYPPVEHMTKEEISDELIKKNWDPFIWHEQKFQPDERMKEVVQAYKEFAFGKEDDPQEEINRIVQKVRVQLVTWDNKGIHETGKASIHRGILEEQLNERQFARHEMMVAALYHPDWGKETREILEYITKVPALREGERLVERGGELVHLLKTQPNQPGDSLKYEHKDGFMYPDLASDRGRDILSRTIEEEFPEANKMAKWFASKLFTSMDMLTIPLMQMQLKTMTRAHNGGIGGKDYAALYNPLAGYIHRSERYGGVESDWMGWWLYYLPDFGHTDRFGRRVARDEDGNSLERKKQHDADYLEEKQHLIKFHQRSYFDGSGSEGEIPMVGFNESYFPHLYEALYLHEGEYLEIGDKVIDWQEEEVDKKQRLPGYDLYFVAESGWEKLLELTFKKIDNNLEYEHILEELSEGGKGGILSEFMGSGAGKAKMFPGRHLELCFKPLMLHLVRRIFALYKGRGRQAELRLFDGVIQSLEDSKSGGLESYADQIDEIIRELRGPLYGQMSMSLQKRDRGNRNEETAEYMRAWYRDELDEEPPADVFGYGVVLDGNYQKENYLRVLRNDPGGKIPVPLTRQGSLIQKHE